MKQPAPGSGAAAGWGEFSGEGTRTLDTADMSRMLYHLSYAAAEKTIGTIAAGIYAVNRIRCANAACLDRGGVGK